MPVTFAKKARNLAEMVAPINPDLARQLKGIDSERARMSQVARAVPKTDPVRRAAAFQRVQAIEQREQEARQRALTLLRRKL